MSSSTKTFNEIFLEVIVGYLLAKADEWSTQFLATCCTVAQDQLISFLKLLLSSKTKTIESNTELVIAYYAILEKKN